MAHAAPEWSGLDEEAAGGRYLCYGNCYIANLVREYNIMGRATFIDLAGSERLKHTNSKVKVRLALSYAVLYISLTTLGISGNGSYQ